MAGMSAFLNAVRREPASHTPVWFMRQAGRSLPEYKKIRSGNRMLDACRDPALVTEITLQPVRRYGVDAAIFFSDIVVPVAAAGVPIDIKAGVGPVLDSPVRTMADVEAIRELSPEDLPYITEAVRLLVRELGEDTPLIGFAGAPFTLASYLVEGGPSRTYVNTKTLMYGAPDVWHALCAKLARMARVFLETQIAAGARTIQLFDSWAGALSEADYRQFAMPHSAAVLDGLRVPRIHFGVGTGHMLEAIGEAGADVVGVDWRTPLDVASARLGGRYAVQGNLDPTVLFAPADVVEREVRRVLAEGAKAPGHVFNLGHGVMPDNDPDVLKRVVDLVHAGL
ncbi:uroporphyrinogen decarboxylase [Longispora albida]|uniref:uroporphyrinogen decarboxylase n=1 Tax=Longispora albida TaxID=203523 RepID=UPI000361BC42|nr:uroporphyrinogen decarboxylase [Longispora albida]